MVGGVRTKDSQAVQLDSPPMPQHIFPVTQFIDANLESPVLYLLSSSNVRLHNSRPRLAGDHIPTVPFTWKASNRTGEGSAKHHHTLS